MEETHLTPRQRKWLETSRKIGPGRFTPSERKTLEDLYAAMTSQEQEELQDFIQEKYLPADPISKREAAVWTSPSPGLRKALEKAQRISPPPVSDKRQQ